MPIPDPTARATALACIVGPTRAAGAPDSYTVHLFDGDPTVDGAEIADTTDLGAGPVANGYVPGTLDADDFTFDGEVATGWADMPASLVAYPETATHFLLRSGGLDWFAAPLLEPLDVTGASDPYTLGCSLFFDSAVEPPA